MLGAISKCTSKNVIVIFDGGGGRHWTPASCATCYLQAKQILLLLLLINILKFIMA